MEERWVAKGENSTQSLPHELVKACLMARRRKCKRKEKKKKIEGLTGKAALFLQLKAAAFSD